MTPSPSSSLNTPVGMGATHSPMQDDQAYKDKVLKLSKYIEPLKKAIREKTGENEGSKCQELDVCPIAVLDAFRILPPQISTSPRR